jgi:DNA-binding winged helix-turn-helix (wHTH) protein
MTVAVLTADRQAGVKAPSAWVLGPYRLDAEGHLRLGSVPVALSPLQRRLLVVLVRQAGRVIEKDALLDQVWGHRQVSDVSLARAVHGLRRILDQGPLGGGVIHTIYGSGYRFDGPVSPFSVPDPAASEAHGTPFPPEPVLSRFVEGLVLLRQRDPLRLEGAAHQFRRCLEHAPHFAPALLSLAATQLARYQWGQLPAAAVEGEISNLLEQAEGAGADPHQLHALRLEVLSLLNWQPRLAEERFASWLPDQLPCGPALHSWARHLLVTGRSGQALELLQHQLEADHPSGWMLAALAAAQGGDRDGAIRSLHIQLNLDGTLVAPRLLLALLLAEAGRATQALSELSRCGILDGPAASLSALPALVLAQAGAPDRAAALLDQALARPTADQTMVSLWGVVALALGRQDRAALLLEEAVLRRCGLAPLLLAWPQIARYDHTPALRAFRQAMARSFGGFDAAVA